MAAYSIFFKDSVRKELAAIPKGDLLRIMERIGTLAENPRPMGCEKLSGQEKYRLRQRNYHIVYSIQDSQLTVWVVTISDRSTMCAS